MQEDAKAGGARTRAEYLQILRKAGGPSSKEAARQILLREAKRAFGRPLSRRAPKAGKARRGARGRRASNATRFLREKLRKDLAAGTLGDAAHYTHWLVGQPGSKLGLKQARPLVYRELRAMQA